MAGTDALVDLTAKILRKISPAQRESFETLQEDVVEEPIPTLRRRGFERRDGGAVAGVESPVEFSASSQQVAGLWPFCVGSSAPLVGTILGRNLKNSQVVCADPVNWYLKGIIKAPSALVLGLNALGKSSLVVRMLLGIMDSGFKFMALADTKPDYAGLTEEVGGKVIEVGPNKDAVNPLDAGPLWARLIELRAAHLEEAAAAETDPERARAAQTRADLIAELMAEIHSRRVSTMQALFRLSGDKKALAVADDTLLLSIGIREAARRCEAENPPRQPLIEDVKNAVKDGTEEMRLAVLVEDNAEYKEESKALVRALNVFDSNGMFGDVFSRQTSSEIDLDRSCCFNISSVRAQNNPHVLAAVQVVCWSYGQAAVSAAKTLAKAGLMDESHYVLVLDELWQVLGVDDEMINFVDELTRLNRSIGVGQILISHSPKDYVFSDDRLSGVAQGFLDRSPMKFYAGLVEHDMDALSQIVPMSEREKQQLVDWSPEGVMDPNTNTATPPVGRGKFLMKAGQGPGVPFQVRLTAVEHRIHDTNEAWREAIDRANAL